MNAVLHGSAATPSPTCRPVAPASAPPRWPPWPHAARRPPYGWRTRDGSPRPTSIPWRSRSSRSPCSTGARACLEDRWARAVAAAHPSLPPELIVALLSDDEQVAEAAGASPSLAPAAMADRMP
ncbi:hypothetical protein AB0F77_04305 [Streptomyces sp. NPDC026672]|uniref:hypothetical protein n=1 Tax=unclassified Streptomyces TaxID=2593676 RepID=UPI0033F8112C